MTGLTRYLKLPFQFDEMKLVNDLNLIVDSKWLPHFNTGGYQGDWKVIPLYSRDGDENNIFAFSDDSSAISETPLLKDCDYLKEVINTFHFPILSVRLLRLGVGAEIKPHRDHELGYENNNFRLHIPITTNENVNFILDGTRLQMLPGECWYTNVNYVHSVSNHGNTNRVHLVIDGKRNSWSDDLFFSLAPEESFVPVPQAEFSPETMRRMIQELQLNNQPATKQLILDLKEKLKG